MKGNKYIEVKKYLDFLISACALLLLSPGFLLIYIALKIEEPGENAVFTQERIGRNGNVFMIYKFRSMKESSPHQMPAHKVEDMDSLSGPIGKFLRNTGIDELPQLVNVIRGDMSIVGPRPLIIDEGQIHDKRMKAGIYRLRPGITGLAQIHGGNTISDSLKLKWDKLYLTNISLLLDFKICLKTAGLLFMTAVRHFK